MTINNIDKILPFLDFTNGAYDLYIVKKDKDQNNPTKFKKIKISVFDEKDFLNTLEYLIPFAEKNNARIMLSLNSLTYEEAYDGMSALINSDFSIKDKTKFLLNFDTTSITRTKTKYQLIDVDDMSKYSEILETLKKEHISIILDIPSKTGRHIIVRNVLLPKHLVSLYGEYANVLVFYSDKYKNLL